jgi:DNA repair photolyase
MIEEYYGELFLMPIPLEFSGNRCSYQCSYCFASGNRFKGGGDYASVLRQIERVFNKGSNPWVTYFLRNKYPVCLSNRTDPFSLGNTRTTIQLIRLLSSRGVPVFVQTKGGDGAFEVADSMSPSVWYVSMSFFDNRKRCKIEPNTPSIESRKELIAHLIHKGHKVLIGMNPMVPDWIPESDARALVDWAASVGVSGIISARLHLSAEQQKRMTVASRSALSGVLPWAGKRTVPSDVVNHDRYIRSLCQDEGVEYFSIGQPWPTKIYEPFRELYPKTLSVVHDFINWAWNNKEDGEEVHFEEFEKVMMERLPGGLFELRSHLCKVCRVLGAKGTPDYWSFRDMLKILWQEWKHPWCLVRNQNFAFDSLDEESYRIREDGYAVLRFSRAGFEGPCS